MGDVSHVTEEAVVGQQVVKVFQGQDAEKQRFGSVNEKTRRLHMRMVATRLASSSMVQLAAGLALVLMMAVATRPSMLNEISAGTFTVVFWAMIGTIPPLKRLTMVQSQVQKGIAAAESIFAVLDTRVSHRNFGVTKMAVRLYQDVAGGNDLNLFIDPQQFNKTIDTDRIAVITELQGLSDDARIQVALCEGSASLADYDTKLQTEEWAIRDRLDYYTLYANRVHNLTVRDGAWFSPDLVDSFCGETGGNVVGLSIDGINSTFWKHSVDETHVVVYKLRDYPKKIGKIRFRYGGSAAIERLENITVKAAKNVAKIDDAESILETGINPTWPAGPSVWVEHTLALKKPNARYVKLEFETAHSSSTMQIREFEVWVETRDP